MNTTHVDKKFLLQNLEVDYFIKHLAQRYSASSKNNFNFLEKNLVICPLSKDAKSANNENQLPFVVDVINKFIQNHGRDYHLLIPMKLCRGYLKIPIAFSYAKRQHFVLVEIDLSTMHVQVHDSLNDQTKYYPDKFTELHQIDGTAIKYNPKVDYHAYNVQQEQFSGIYYVLAYLESILETGDSLNCCNIKLDIAADYANKADFFKKKNIPESVAYFYNVPMVSNALTFITSNQEVTQHMTASSAIEKSPSPLLSDAFEHPAYVVELDPIFNGAPKPLK